MAGKLSGAAIEANTITATQLSSNIGPISSQLRLVGSGISLNVANTGYFSGNVGIGITNPGVNFHLLGSASQASQRIRVQSHDTASANAGIEFYGRDGSNVNKVAALLTANANLCIHTDNTEKVRITDAGNVGIGITTPNRIGFDTNAKVLTLAGPQRSFFEIGSESPIINDISGGIVFNSATNVKAGLYCRLDANSNGSLIFLSGGSTERVRITDAGNVGIGTTNPNARLSFGTSIIDNKLYLYDDTSDKYGFGIRSDSFLVYSGAAGASTGGILLGKFDGTTFTENMRVRNDGVVVKPKQPCFATYGTNGNYALSGVSTVPFDATPDINVGSHYNSATSIFTAPVAGYYFVSFSVLIYPNTIDAGEYITVWASKNDGSYGASGSIPMARQSNQENQTTMGSQGIVYLAANDNLRIKVEPLGTGLTLYLLNGHAHFAAYLLG